MVMPVFLEGCSKDATQEYGELCVTIHLTAPLRAEQPANSLDTEEQT